MRLSHVSLCALAATCILLGGCATPPDDQKAASRSEASEPMTGSNLPRRDRKSVSNVVITSPAALKEAQERASSRVGPEN